MAAYFRARRSGSRPRLKASMRAGMDGVAMGCALRRPVSNRI
jgi:hypothetical protein